METVLVPLGTAVLLGVLHAFEVDHMLAVTTFVSRRPALGAAARFGARWGIGHSIAVLAAGGLLLATGVRWPAHWDAVGEVVVGLVLAGLGVWALVSSRKLHLHPADAHGGAAQVHVHPHGHPHEHAHGSAHAHDHGGITLVGLLHGLAGTGGVVALVPLTLLRDTTLGLGYLAAFGLGVTLAMTIFALAAALAFRHATRGSLVWGRRVTALVGVAGIAVGAFWVWRAAGGM